MSLQKIRTFWKNYGFEISIGCLILFILVCAIFRIGKKGSWSGLYMLPKEKKNKESRGETECRKVLENYFGQKFPKMRPDFLRNSVTGNFNLELDCYNDKLGLACEYNGVQHYKYTPFYHKNKDAFQNQKYRDYMKKDLCTKNGVKLIEVPYTVRVEDIKTFIISKLRELGIKNDFI